jgi:leucine dehydrogenase
VKLFETTRATEHQQVLFCHDPETNLKAIIALHDTDLGSAMGATRLFPYASEDAALRDALRLSRGMTYKAACANIPVGGGKGVIIADPNQKTDCLIRAYGRFVERLKGQFITGQDVNISLHDVHQIHRETSYVMGVKEESGGPVPLTAAGVMLGMQAAVEFRLQRQSFEGLKVAVQGVGNVGETLCRLLSERGAQLFISDLRRERAEEVAERYGATIVDQDAVYALPVDVFAPCALGAVLNNTTIPRLQASIVAGAANNQLEDEQKHSLLLTARNILYCPDYVINAGGLINVYNEMIGYNKERVQTQLNNVYGTLLEIFGRAQRSEITTQEAAQQLAKKRIEQSKKAKSKKDERSLMPAYAHLELRQLVPKNV